jgi:hypothetical protein
MSSFQSSGHIYWKFQAWVTVTAFILRFSFHFNFYNIVAKHEHLTQQINNKKTNRHAGHLRSWKHILCRVVHVRTNWISITLSKLSFVIRLSNLVQSIERYEKPGYIYEHWERAATNLSPCWLCLISQLTETQNCRFYSIPKATFVYYQQCM